MLSDLLSDIEKISGTSQKWSEVPAYKKHLASMAFQEALMKGPGYFKIMDSWDLPSSRGPFKILEVEIYIGEFTLAIPTYVDGKIVLVDFDLWDHALERAGRPSEKGF